MEKKVRFKATQSLALENSFMTVKEQKDVELNITINIFDAERGSFELYDEETEGEEWYAEGGLWFNGKDLIDYDGVFALPKVIEDKLTEMGYNLEDL